MPWSRSRRPGWAGLERGGGGDVQDRSAAAVQHGGKEHRRQLGERRDVDFDDFRLALGESGDGAVCSEAGVVDQDIDVKVPLRERLSDLAGTGRPGQVGGGMTCDSGPYFAARSSASSSNSRSRLTKVVKNIGGSPVTSTSCGLSTREPGPGSCAFPMPAIMAREARGR